MSELQLLLKPMIQQRRFWTHGLTIIDGCSKISAGCLNCWAEKFSLRTGSIKKGLLPNRFDGTLILKWNLLDKILPKRKRKTRVYSYWNDVFHENVSNTFRDTLFEQIYQSDDYHFIMTKRPVNAINYLVNKKIHDKTFIMVTTENMDCLNSRFLPLNNLKTMGWKTALLANPLLENIILPEELQTDWIICGPERGKPKRKFDPQWAINLQKQAREMNVPFLFSSYPLDGVEYHEVPEY